MIELVRTRLGWDLTVRQPVSWCLGGLLTALGIASLGSVGFAAEAPTITAGSGEKQVTYTLPAEGEPLVVSVPDAEASTADQMKPYTDVIPGTDITFSLAPIPAGAFRMGTPEDEAGREDDEGPQHAVQLSPFWIGTHEVTWNEYDIWKDVLDIERRNFAGTEPTPLDEDFADAYTRPTPPYTPMDFGMGVDGYPAICMTQLAAQTYCEWLSLKTGRYYRLPTEAEWEYACRAGTTTAYSWGDDPAGADEYAWYIDNADWGYHPVGEKKPNPWGLYDIHGNVAEWVLDEYRPDFYETSAAGGAAALNPLAAVQDRFQPYTHLVRGGSWDDLVEDLRSGSRRPSEEWWKQEDPQIPKSVWYFTDAHWIGFRVCRPLEAPAGWREKLIENIKKDLAAAKEGQIRLAPTVKDPTEPAAGE